MSCRCCNDTVTTAELKERHGSLEEFEKAVYGALGEISIDEARAAIVRYRVQWTAAAVRESTAHTIGAP